MLGEAATGSDGSATSAGEIVAIGAGDAFDDAKVAQAGELPGEGGRRALGEERPEVGAAQPGDVEAGTLQSREQGLFGAAEKVQAPEIAAIDGTGLGETVERANAGREIVQAGEILEIAAIATE